jgi:hypothetical protein
VEGREERGVGQHFRCIGGIAWHSIAWDGIYLLVSETYRWRISESFATICNGLAFIDGWS